MAEAPKQRLAAAFARGRDEERALLMPFLVCGYPDDDTFVALARTAAEAGADVLEIGIPFSDPIMDGPVIQAAATAVLRRGMPTQHALELIGRASEAAGIPLVAMTYYNLPFRMGVDRFATTLAAAGASGAILPDLSVEESEPWRKACTATAIAPVFIAAQTSTDERLRMLGEAGDGFIYAASLMGVTGVRETLNERARSLVDRIRAVSDLPVALGIGVSTAEQVRQVAVFADGVIVGSALVSTIADTDDPIAAARTFLGELRASVGR